MGWRLEEVQGRVICRSAGGRMEEQTAAIGIGVGAVRADGRAAGAFGGGAGGLECAAEPGACGVWAGAWWWRSVAFWYDERMFR